MSNIVKEVLIYHKITGNVSSYTGKKVTFSRLKRNSWRKVRPPVTGELMICAQAPQPPSYRSCDSGSDVSYPPSLSYSILSSYSPFLPFSFFTPSARSASPFSSLFVSLLSSILHLHNLLFTRIPTPIPLSLISPFLSSLLPFPVLSSIPRFSSNSLSFFRIASIRLPLLGLSEFLSLFSSSCLAFPGLYVQPSLYSIRRWQELLFPNDFKFAYAWENIT